ncbi:hypothetical protein C8F04DRAFT_1366128 [Mycena alexandri]|uniref:Glutamyl/glutaminyl-tRNA synthetase class Ib catalytic domain-containing protein n=1 Tax=Mycena alexandri TaxID=1745969 RepID=A0AAD6TFR0_9AGAR|nr:hypothetical protein C8F04DRAFT_1366128 [Mycena alexandri]
MSRLSVTAANSHRSDDTNPSKEKVEFEETILDDLRLLNAVGENDIHTSDYFSQLHDYAVQLIVGRDATKEENLHRFSEMSQGILGQDGARLCLRAKISVGDPNKALRDPVIYRCSSVPRHRTGDKWKVYPTYEFACPVVDSLEGVTHALRTNEYRDRNPQYHWMIEALGLRRVDIWDFRSDCTQRMKSGRTQEPRFSRLNFIYIVLSKRKLQQFVDKGLVRGWDDPRFPTARRGLTIEALQQFMLQQGPSQAVLSMEWDSIWALNKKIVDPRALSVPVHVRNGPAECYTTLKLKHKKSPEIGPKLTPYSSDIMIEQVDALGEEITLMDNAIVRSKTLTVDGHVSSITVDLHLEGDFKATKKKITWLAESPDRPLDYDYIITDYHQEENRGRG